MYYSRKKYQLFKDISQERAQNMAAEIKKYRGDKNLTINGNSSIKKGKVDFEERKIELSYSDISTIMNECPFYDTVHVRGLLFNKSEEKLKLKNGKMLRIFKVKIKDQTALMKFTLFRDLIDKVKEYTGYSMTYQRADKYNNVRYLKTTESTTFTPNDDINVVVTENDSLDENTDTFMSVRICAVNIKSCHA